LSLRRSRDGHAALGKETHLIANISFHVSTELSGLNSSLRVCTTNRQIPVPIPSLVLTTTQALCSSTATSRSDMVATALDVPRRSIAMPRHWAGINRAAHTVEASYYRYKTCRHELGKDRPTTVRQG